MLRFFRQIRQRLLTDNKFSKYLLYATGEILLVVIGILIALQVNNWKEEAEIRKEERLLLTNLKADFEVRREELLEFDVYFAREMDALGILLPLFHTGEALPEEQVLDSLLSYSENAYTFNNSFQLLDLLFSTGRIDLIGNEQLKNNLLKWPFLVEETLEEQRYLMEIDIQLGYPVADHYISQSDLSRYFKFRDYGSEEFSSAMKKDYSGLFRSNLYENYLSRRLQTLRIMKSDRLKLINVADEILMLIALELERLDIALCWHDVA
jgi:hypothetical protein